MNVYELSRAWFDFAFDNPEKIKTNHPALFFFAIEHCNRLGWKPKFGLPTSMAMEAVGIKSYNTYIATLTDLVDWGFIKMIEKSKNQYSSNIIALSKNDKATDKALDKALTKHLIKQLPKQRESNYQSIDSIDKQIYNITKDTNIQEYNTCGEDEIDFAKKIIADFGFNEISGFQKLRTVNDFLKIIKNSGRLDYFREQYDNYFLFKNRYGERKHNFSSFFGKQENAFNDGKWDEANWKNMLNDAQNKPINDKPNKVEQIQNSHNAVIDDILRTAGINT